MRKNTLVSILLSGMLLLAFPSCDGILEELYDRPQTEGQAGDYGFIQTDAATHSGTVYVDASDYMRWVFIDFHTRQIDSLDLHVADAVEPEQWDIAIHRYDARTNGGAVLETGYTGFDAVKRLGKIPEGTYVEDIWTTDKIKIDMSHMMEDDGYLVYSDSFYNEELSKWLHVDTSNMPPDYTLSNKVYMIRLKDGTYAAVRLTNFMNAAGAKGYMTLDYIYPFEP